MAPLLTGPLFRPELYHFFPSLDSTNQHAALLAQKGALEGTVVVADHQTQGRGRLGRHWCSPMGTNLYVSIVLRPKISPDKAAQLTLLASLALARTVASAGAESVEIKWPNDLLLNGRKLAGILTEMRTGPHGIQYVIVGMGVNIHGHASTFPIELRSKVVTLAEFMQCTIQRPMFLARALTELAFCYKQFRQEGDSGLRQDWLAFSKVCGRQVRVSLASVSSHGTSMESKKIAPKEIFGTAMALDSEGFLLVRRTNGSIVRILAGDVMTLNED